MDDIPSSQSFVCVFVYALFVHAKNVWRCPDIRWACCIQSHFAVKGLNTIKIEDLRVDTDRYKLIETIVDIN